jgi:hypothetical protein
MTPEQVKTWIADHEQWLVRNYNGVVEITDVSHPFKLSWDAWKNLLGVCSYKEAVTSTQLRMFLEQHKLQCDPGELSAVLNILRCRPDLIPIPPTPDMEPDKSRTWELKQVPKIIHFYWGNTILSFLRFMCLYSFRQFNPDWTIQLHVPSKPVAVQSGSNRDPWCRTIESPNAFSGKNYLSYLPKLGIQIVPFEIQSLGLPENIPEVHKSDILRWHLLGTVGGVWSDMDILFFRPMTCLDFNNAACDSIDTFLYLRRREHKIGFLLSKAENPFFLSFLDLARQNYKPDVCQVVGSDLLDKLYPTEEALNATGGKFLSIGDDPVYWLKHMCVYYTFYADGSSFLRRGSVGLHWYAGAINARPLINGVNHINYLSYPSSCTLMQLLKTYFNQGLAI